MTEGSLKHSRSTLPARSAERILTAPDEHTNDAAHAQTLRIGALRLTASVLL
jgi:hypothetical protein